MTPDADDLCVFAVRRGSISGRFDVRNMRYSISADDIEGEKASLGSLILEEPCYGTSATAIPRTEENQPKYIRITDYDDYGIEQNHEFMTAEVYSEKHFLRIGDILFARSGATVGKTYFYDGTIGPAVFAGYCIRFRFDEKKVLPKYIYWFTKTSIYVKWVKGIQRPPGQPNINKKEYKSFAIITPPYDIQYLLSAKMDTALSKRQGKLQHANDLLEGSNSIILDRLGLTIPTCKEHLVGAVQLCNIIEDKTFSTEHYHPERMAAIHAINGGKHLTVMKLRDLVSFHRDSVNSVESTEKYLGLAGVQSQTGELSGVTEEAAGQAFAYKAGDILFGRLRPYLNKVLLAETNGICSPEFHVLRIKTTSKILPEYLASIIRSDLILLQTKHMMTGNTHPRISNDDVKNLLIPIPSLSIQQQIVTELNRRRQEARRLRMDAEREWSEARAQFEKELLGEKE